MTVIRTVDNWVEILKGLKSHPKGTTETDLALFILKDLAHYTTGRSRFSEDIESLANALSAYREEG